MKSKEQNPKYNYVMLIDDVPLDNFINERLITYNAFSKHVYVNTSATSALEFLNNLSLASKDAPSVCPDIIFVDINMPIIDGFQFISDFMKNTEKRKNKPRLIILTSSVAEIDKEKTALLSHNIILLNKPLTKEMLANI